MATIKDIARDSGVSIATVSHVVNESSYVSPKLRERVLKVIREHNYQPNDVARSLKTSRSKTIGIIVPDIGDPFFPGLVRGAEDVLAYAGYTLLIGNSDNDQAKEEGYYRAFMEKRIAGLISVAAVDQPTEYFRRHDVNSVPIVYADRSYFDLPGDVVTSSNMAGSRTAVAHLADMGFKRIASITGPLKVQNSRRRLEGYRRALRDAGLSEDPSFVREGKFDEASGYQQMLSLLELDVPPDAVFVQNSQMTLGAFRALQDKEVACPQQIALISFGEESWFKAVRPQISAISHNSYDVGAAAAELLLRRIAGKLTGNYVRRSVANHLVIRESTKVRRIARGRSRKSAPAGAAAEKETE